MDTTAYTYNLRGQLKQETETTENGSSTNTYNYNARGDMTSKYTNGVEQEYHSYDTLGRLARLDKYSNGVGYVEFNYDSDGNRVKKISTQSGVASVPTYVLWWIKAYRLGRKFDTGGQVALISGDYRPCQVRSSYIMAVYVYEVRQAAT